MGYTRKFGISQEIAVFVFNEFTPQSLSSILCFFMAITGFEVFVCEL